jgi:hypothetical protein
MHVGLDGVGVGDTTRDLLGQGVFGKGLPEGD